MNPKVEAIYLDFPSVEFARSFFINAMHNGGTTGFWVVRTISEETPEQLDHQVWAITGNGPNSETTADKIAGLLNHGG